MKPNELEAVFRASNHFRTIHLKREEYGRVSEDFISQCFNSFLKKNGLMCGSNDFERITGSVYRHFL